MEGSGGVEQGRPAPRRRDGGPHDQGSASAKILIVEDDPDVVAVTQMLLERRGYRIVTAPSAPEGKRKVEGERPDLILLDIMLPLGTEGFDLVWSLRKHPDPVLRDTPIVVMSAIHRTTELRLYPEEADPEYAPGEFLPVQAFLDKPVIFDELARVVESVLAGRRRQ